ncbi:MAG: TIGR04283 family arsenosugar biosynthesis glycosyltransferase [Lentisphaeria bacterium]|nr:TIGR04283 family arsenosugar biosynthesis glycosyltransferase [Lentisphaeria bacterium]
MASRRMRPHGRMTMNDRIIFFTRFPVPGQAKTRMIPALGPAGAARLHRRLAERAVAVARQSCLPHGVDATVCFTGGSRRDFRAWLGTGPRFRKQRSGDLGERMRQAIAQALADGAAHVLVAGTDVPGISADTLRQAFGRLADHDVVLGPAGDGGYYLIGMNRCHPELFTDIDWGSERVAEQTRAAIRHLGLTVAELPILDDVDRPEDLARLRDDPQFTDVFTGRARVSVVIPTLNEAEALPATLERLRGVEGVEIIVADGGSRDATCAIAEQADATVIEVAGGRAAQQNAGAARADGRHLLFLHADTLLPDNFADTVRRALDNPATVAGAFKLRTDGRGPRMRLVEWATNLRSSVLHLPYGDQGLFLEKRVFNELGGFGDLPIMEDFDLVRRLRRRGRVVTVPDRVVTSARRWRRLGVLRTLLRNQAMILGYWLGVSPERLARFYRRM